MADNKVKGWVQTSKIGNSIRLVADLVKVAIVHSDNEAWIIQQVAQNQADMRVAVQAERRLLSTIAVDTTTLADFKFECSKAQLFYMTAMVTRTLQQRLS